MNQNVADLDVGRNLVHKEKYGDGILKKGRNSFLEMEEVKENISL